MDPHIQIHYRSSKTKAYSKELHGVRVETTINNPADFGVKKTVKARTSIASARSGAPPTPGASKRSEKASPRLLTRPPLERLLRPELDGFWIHIDCDALDDALMPAVDYRLPDGLTWEELESVIRLAIDSGRAVGVEITIFNPALESDGSIAQALVRCLARGLAPSGSR